MRKLTERLARLESRNPSSIKRWHHIVVDGVSEEQAIAEYEAKHGSTAGDGLVIRTIVDVARP